MSQDASKPQNIFEAASRIERERKEKGRPKSTPTPAAQAPPGGTSLDEIFARCHQMHREISESLDRAFKQAGVTPSQLRTYVSKPKNFSSGDWNKVEEGKKQSEKLLTDLKGKIGRLPEPPSETPTPPAPQKGPSTPPPQEPTLKKRPKIVTRRQWIGM